MLTRIHKLKALVITVWSIGAVLPGCAVAFSGSRPIDSQVKMVSRLYGPEMGAYLGYCPTPLLVYAMALLVLAPLLVLLACISDPEWKNSRQRQRLGRVAVGTAVEWILISIVGSLVISFVGVIARTSVEGIWAWAWHLWIPLAVSALPAVGLAICVRSNFASQRLALVVGLFAVVLIGYLGFFSRTLKLAWAPGAIDQMLFSGVPAQQIRGCASAAAWFTAMFLAAQLRKQLGMRRDSSAVDQSPQ